MNADIHETVYSHDYGDDEDPELKGMFMVDAGERWSISMVKRLKEKYPDQVVIKKVNKDGSIHAYLPFDWMRIIPKAKHAKREYSAEERAAIGERLRAGRKSG